MRRGVQRSLLIAGSIAILVCTTALGQPGRSVHVVAPGDTLFALAATYDTTVDVLRALNGLQGDFLRVGAELIVPADAQPARYRPYLSALDDTWQDVAAAVERSVEALRSANPDIPPGEEPAGRLLLIPPGEGVTIRARAGEELLDIAARYWLDPEALAEANGVGIGEILLAGQPVLLPLGAAERVVVQASVAFDARARHRVAQQALLVRAPLLLEDLAWPDTGFDMPVVGRLSSHFGWRNISVGGNTFHGGIDIAADPGAPVVVARPGVVERTGWIGAYGYAVYVDHGDGSQTRYAHLRAIHVQPGEVLLRGDLVGQVGSTGASTGPHLHFEVRIEGRAVDPLAYLDVR